MTRQKRSVSQRRRQADAKNFHPGLQTRRRAGLSAYFQRRAAEKEFGPSVRGRASVVSRAFLGRIALVGAIVLAVCLFVSIGVSAHIRSRQMVVRIDNGNVVKDIVTQATTVRELIDNHAISLGPYDAVAPSENTRLTDGMVVTIDRAMVLFVTTNAELKQVYMTTGTVADALKKAGIAYSSEDIVTPALDTALLPGMRIRHVAVEHKIISEFTKVPFEVEQRNASSLEVGTQLLDQKGQEGTKTREIKVTLHDGVEVERIQLSEVMTKEPVNKVILNGTKPKPTPKPVATPKPTKTNNGTKPNATTKPNNDNGAGETGNNSIYSHVTAADLKIPGVPTDFGETLVLEVTAYTHTGNQVAIGGWPQYTRTRSKPGTVAVDPATIPYGTLVYITGYGYARAEDTGSFKGTRPLQIDVFMNTRNECIKWGRRRGVMVYIVQENFKR